MPKTKFLTALAHAVVAWWLLFLGGCATLPSADQRQDGEDWWAWSALGADFPFDFAAVWQASELALHDLGYPVLKTERDGPSGSLQTQDAHEHRLVLRINEVELPPGSVTQRTRVSVDVGWWGDRTAAQRILSQILMRAAPGERLEVSPLTPIWQPVAPGESPP